MNWWRWIVLLGAGSLLWFAGQSLPLRGDPESPAARHVSPRYIEQGLNETGTVNMVTTIIADYRSFDTLGEVLVIFTAGIACFFIMMRRED